MMIDRTKHTELPKVINGGSTDHRIKRYQPDQKLYTCIRNEIMCITDGDITIPVVFFWWFSTAQFFVKIYLWKLF